MKENIHSVSKIYTVDDLLAIMQRLRDECPWDAKQTHESLKPYLLEESYEVLESIDTTDWKTLASELGDLLLQIVFHCEIASRHKEFNFTDVVHLISQKLVDRHPHVFVDKTKLTAKDVQDNWEHSKILKEKRTSLLAGIPRATPALLQAQRLQEKASTVGFDWDDLKPVLNKIEEEWLEFKTAISKNSNSQIAQEFGDLLFSIVNLGRLYGINAEDALRLTNNKFIRRFKYIEQQYNYDPKAMKNESLEKLDKHWNDAKQNEK